MIVCRLFVSLAAGVLPLSAQSGNPVQPVVPAAIRAEPLAPPQAVPVRPAAAPIQATPVAPVTTVAPTPAQPVKPPPQSPPIIPAKPSPAPPPTAGDLQMQPSWDTQKLARTYVFTTPALVIA